LRPSGFQPERNVHGRYDYANRRAGQNRSHRQRFRLVVVVVVKVVVVMHLHLNAFSILFIKKEDTLL